MTEIERKDYFTEVCEECCWGDNIISEWTNFLSIDVMYSFYAGAYLSTILISQACMESYLRYEYYSDPCPSSWGFYELINHSDLDDLIKDELHVIRKYRNKWIHVKDPENDDDLLLRPEYYNAEMEQLACSAIKLMFIIIYRRQSV